MAKSMTAAEAPEKVNGRSAAPSEAPNPAGGNGAAQFSAAELAAIEQELGIETPTVPVKKPVAPPAEEPAAEVRADTESADDAGEQVDGQSPESAEAGEESNTEGDPESDEDGEWAQFMALAKGDPKKALKLARAYYDEEAEAKPGAPQPKPAAFSEDDAVAKFYEEAKGEDPKAEQKALANLVKRLREATQSEIEATRAEVRAEAQREARAQRDIAALARAYPTTWKQDAPAIKAHYALLAKEGMPVDSMPPLLVYRDLLQRRSEKAIRGESTKAAASDVAAAKKATMASAAGTLPGGRPAGPTERKHISTHDHEMNAVAAMFGNRVRALP